MITRTLRQDEDLPNWVWFNLGKPDPNWVFVVEDDQEILGVLITSPIAETVMFLRLVGNPFHKRFGWYRRLMGYTARSARERGYSKFWVFWESSLSAHRGISQLYKSGDLCDSQVWNHIIGRLENLEIRYGWLVRN